MDDSTITTSEITKTLLKNSLTKLSDYRPIFHSEADFQHSLAWQIKVSHPDAEIRLETPMGRNEVGFVDLRVQIDNLKIAIELKYLVKKINYGQNDSESFFLKNQGAQDIRRYDVIKDLCRVESLVKSKDSDSGAVIILTNDEQYWKKRNKNRITIDSDFRIHQDEVLTGERMWRGEPSAGTIKNRDKKLTVEGNYRLNWLDFSDLEEKNGTFRYLFICVE